VASQIFFPNLSIPSGFSPVLPWDPDEKKSSLVEISFLSNDLLLARPVFLLVMVVHKLGFSPSFRLVQLFKNLLRGSFYLASHS